MLPRLGSSKLITSWLAVTIILSVVGLLDGGWIASWAALEPWRIWRGQVWRLATWALVEVGPMSLVVTCMAIYRLGSELAGSWGDRRLRRFMIALVVIGGVVTSLLSLATGDASIWRCEGLAVINALVIAWARQFPDNTLVFYGVVTLRGRGLVALTVGFSTMFALRLGIVEMVPELVACLGAYLYPRGRSNV